MDLRGVRRMFGGLPVVSVATVGPDGAPHVVPLWFVWLEDALYASCRQGSRTWRNATGDPRVSITIDLGRSWTELAGIVLEGVAELLPAEHPSIRVPISSWHEKYRSLLAGEGFARFTEQVTALGFLRVEPTRLSAWDHARA
jgi:nitroimidazol reductase NimA-like FMN-containing flavoprotein (pyridoxamine 5'-phosphate oxidase superfamily)